MRAQTIAKRRTILNDNFVKVTEDHTKIAGNPSVAIMYALLEFLAEDEGPGDMSHKSIVLSEALLRLPPALRINTGTATAALRVLAQAKIVTVSRSKNNTWTFLINWPRVNEILAMSDRDRAGWWEAVRSSELPEQLRPKTRKRFTENRKVESQLDGTLPGTDSLLLPGTASGMPRDFTENRKVESQLDGTLPGTDSGPLTPSGTPGDFTENRIPVEKSNFQPGTPVLLPASAALSGHFTENRKVEFPDVPAWYTEIRMPSAAVHFTVSREPKPSNPYTGSLKPVNLYIGSKNVEEPYSTTTGDTVRKALHQYAPADEDAVQQLVKACREKAPDCTAADIVAAIHQKAALLNRGVENPTGWLIRAVPKKFEGEQWRQERQERQRAQQQAAAGVSPEDLRRVQEWRAIVADPLTTELEKRIAQGNLESLTLSAPAEQQPMAEQRVPATVEQRRQQWLHHSPDQITAEPPIFTLSEQDAFDEYRFDGQRALQNPALKSALMPRYRVLQNPPPSAHEFGSLEWWNDYRPLLAATRSQIPRMPPGRETMPGLSYGTGNPG